MQSWKPKRTDWSEEGARKYVNDLLDGIEASDGVRITYSLARWSGERRLCMAELDEYGICGAHARYVVTSTSQNSFKRARRESKFYVCSLRHIGRRVRSYFGIVTVVADTDWRMKHDGA